MKSKQKKSGGGLVKEESINELQAANKRENTRKPKKKEKKTKYRGKKEYKTNRKKTCSEPNSRLLIENLRFLQNSVCANLGKQGKHVNLRQIEF